MNQSEKIEITGKSESALYPPSDHSLRANSEQIHSVCVSSNQCSISMCSNMANAEHTAPKPGIIQSPSEKCENSSGIEGSDVSQTGREPVSNSSFSSYKLNTSYLDRFITSAVVSSELIRMRVYLFSAFLFQ